MSPVRRLLLATHNAHKVEELRRILGPRLDGIELLAYDGPEPVEDGDTFEANALIKARAAFEYSGIASIADDSGISVDALGGAPGIFSARYAGTRDDGDNLRLVLERMTGVDDRRAYFTCAAAFVADGVEHVELGVWPGTVLREPHGDHGFGYDPIFRPDGLTVSSAELSVDEKNMISHRAVAFAKLLDYVAATQLG
ncbi:MAG TPA: RdgB/HAM1 family non-canonical purine NTP pyrophosphatase [Galbitalea sp.]|nr:RdgB/HAM1 family non-canonical purine NTP pyrophosphatase [Galbitalea sp.]